MSDAELYNDLITKSADLIESDGSYNGAIDMELNLYKQVLVNLLSENKSFKHYMRVTCQETQFRIIHQGLKAAKNATEGENKKDKFFNSLIQGFKGLEKKGYRYLFYINIRLPDPYFKVNFNIDGYRGEWNSFDSFKDTNYFFRGCGEKTKKDLKRLYGKDINIQECSSFSIYVNGVDQEICLLKACEIYDQFLGLINYALYKNISSYQFGLNQNLAYTELTGMNLIYVLEKNKYVTERSLIQYSRTKVIDFNKDKVENVKKGLKMINTYNKKYDLHNDVLTFFLTYQKAMKATDYDTRFLYFWHTIELLLHEKEEGNSVERNIEVIRKVQILFKDNWIMNNRLIHIKDIRNKLAHGKKVNIDIEDIQFIKFISEELFEFIISQKRSYKFKPHFFKLTKVMDYDLDTLIMKKNEILEQRKILEEAIGMKNSIKTK